MLSIIDAERAKARIEALKQEIAHRQKQRRNWTFVALAAFLAMGFARFLIGATYLSENTTLAMVAFIWVLMILDQVLDQVMLIDLRVNEQSLEKCGSHFNALSGGQNLHRFISQEQDIDRGHLLEEFKRSTLATVLGEIEYTRDHDTLLVTHVWS